MRKSKHKINLYDNRGIERGETMQGKCIYLSCMVGIMSSIQVTTSDRSDGE